MLAYKSVVGLALELGRYNITVNSYAPGLIETPMGKCQHDVLNRSVLKFEQRPLLEDPAERLRSWIQNQ